MRRYGLDAKQAGAAFGLLAGVASILSNVLVGWLTSRLVGRGGAWAPRIAAIGSLASVPAAALFILAPTLPLSLLGLALQSVFSVFWLGPTIATVQMMAPPHRRATAAACLVASYTLIGFGLGPVIAGLVGDALRTSVGERSIGWGLLALQPFALWASIHFLAATRHLAAVRKQSLP
jgi:MFS family permease